MRWSAFHRSGVACALSALSACSSLEHSDEASADAGFADASETPDAKAPIDDGDVEDATAPADGGGDANDAGTQDTPDAGPASNDAGDGDGEIVDASEPDAPLPSTRGLVLHLQASSLSLSLTPGALVELWPDSSGQRNDAQTLLDPEQRAPHFADDAVSGRPGIVFDGVDDYMDLGLGAGFAESLTIAFAVRFDTASGADTVWSNASLADSEDPERVFESTRTERSFAISYHDAANEPPQGPSLSMGGFDEAIVGTHVIVIRADAVSGEHTVLFDAMSATAGGFAGTLLGGLLGAAAAPGGEPTAGATALEGAIAEVAMYSRRLDDDELLALRDHLHSKYSVDPELARPDVPVLPLVWLRAQECESRVSGDQQGTLCRIPGTTAVAAAALSRVGGTGAPMFPSVASGPAGRAALRFDPDDEGDGNDSDRDFVRLSSMPVASSGYSVSVVADVQSDIGQLMLLGSDGTSRHTLWGLALTGFVRVESQTRADTSASWVAENLQSPAGSLAIGQTFVMTLVGSPAGQSLFLDGALVANLPSANPADLSVIELGFSAARFHLYEALIYPRTLQDDELDQLHESLRSRYLQP